MTNNNRGLLWVLAISLILILPFLWKDNSKYQFFKSQHFKEIIPVSGAKKAVDMLSENNDLYIVTGRPYSSRKETSGWVEKYFPKKFKDIYFDKNHSSVEVSGKHKTKSDICLDIGAKILIDDLLIFANNVHYDIQVLLYNKPWNQGNTSQNVKRFDSWKEISAFINNST